MKGFVPRGKMSKKQRKELDKKGRREWAVAPVTRVIPNKKKEAEKKRAAKAVGTIEMFHRPSNGDFGEVGVIRLDVGSDYENEVSIREILSVIIPPAYELFDCNEIISKVPIYAVEREKAFLSYGFKRTDTCLVGEDGYAYNGYCVIAK